MTGRGNLVWGVLALSACASGIDVVAVGEAPAGDAGDPREPIEPVEPGEPIEIDERAAPAPCAAGFVRCGRLCIEAALAGPACGGPVCAAGPGSAPRPARLGSRGLVQRLELDGASARLTVETGAADGPLTGTVGVDVVRRVGGSTTRAALVSSGNGTWTASWPGRAGDVVDYYLTQRFAPNTFHPASPGGQPRVDSAWFRRVLGAAAPARPAYPLTVTVGGRFRDRHPNEWRYDHYVAGYDRAMFEMTLVDRGDRLDVVIVTPPAIGVGKVDLKWYEVFGPTPFCHDPPALAGTAAPGGMRRDGHRFTHTIEGLTEGQVVDFELTLTDIPGNVVTYYSEWFQYRVGTGALGGRVQHPWAYAAGRASVSAISAQQFAFAQHVPNAAPADLSRFLAGKAVFDGDLSTGTLSNPPTTWDCRGTVPLQPVPVPSAFADRHRAALGPAYDAPSCATCHRLDGRGLPPEAGDGGVGTIVLVGGTGVDSRGARVPHPAYGRQLSRRGAAEGELAVTWEDVGGAFGDRTRYTLRRPRWSLRSLRSGPVDPSAMSVRVAPPLLGVGLLEAVPAATVLGLADPDDADGDGISGRTAQVWDARRGAMAVGRFGWTAAQPTLEQQTASAFAADMGVVASIAAGDGGAVEIADGILADVAAYLRLLSVPPRDNHEDPVAVRGKARFEAAGCGGCHVPNLVTGRDAPAALRGLTIQPFTDLLLHDLGDGLADGFGREWRTAPLWGLAYASHPLEAAPSAAEPNRVVGRARYLHDGRARTLMEAILWHGGEAEAARRAVLAMSAAARDELVAYVRYPFADPLVLGCP